MSDQGNQPNPPYGQQPGGYGQQPGQYGPPPGQYGPPPEQYGQYGQPPGGPGGPPKSSNALIFGLGGAGVLALVILAFTAFVSPGFLTGDDEPTATSGSTTPDPSATGEPSPDPSSDPSSDPSAEPSVPSVSPIPTYDPSSMPEAPPAMRKIAADFVATVNSGNKAGATAALCESSRQRLTATVDRYIQDKVNVKIDKTSGSERLATARLVGTRKGRPAQGLVMVGEFQDPGKPCVLSFLVV